MAAMDQLTNLATLMQTVQGTEQKTKTKGTQTQQTQISDPGVNKLIQDILAGPGGVRSIGGAARSTGLFNATTEDLLLGDLFSRAAVSAELARSPTVTTTDQTQVTETPGIGLGGIGTAIAAGQAGELLFGKGGKGGLLEGAGEAVSNLFGGGAAAGTTAAIPAATTAATSGGAALAGATGSAVVNAGIAGTAGGALAAGGAEAAGAAGAGAAGAGAAGAGASTGFGLNAATAIPLGGSFLSGLIGGREASQEPGSLAMSALAGAYALGPIGLIAAPLASLAGGFLRDLSVVCTALHRRGLLNKRLHTAGDKYFQTVPSVTKLGYWLWGVPVAEKIEAGSVFWTQFTLPIVKSYLRYLAGPRTFLRCFDEPLGGIAHFLGEPFCHCLGKMVLYWETKVKRYN